MQEQRWRSMINSTILNITTFFFSNTLFGKRHVSASHNTQHEEPCDCSTFIYRVGEPVHSSTIHSAALSLFDSNHKKVNTCAMEVFSGCLPNPTSVAQKSLLQVTDGTQLLPLTESALNSMNFGTLKHFPLWDHDLKVHSIWTRFIAVVHVFLPVF